MKHFNFVSEALRCYEREYGIGARAGVASRALAASIHAECWDGWSGGDQHGDPNAGDAIREFILNGCNFTISDRLEGVALALFAPAFVHGS